MIDLRSRKGLAIAAPIFAVLAGCGAIASLIPDINLDDPLKLNGSGVTAQVTADAGGGPSRFLGSVTTGANAALSAPPKIPKKLNVNETLSPTFTITATGGTQPSTITLTNIKVAVSATNSGGATASLPPVTLAGPITLTQTTGTTYAVNTANIAFPTIDCGSVTSQVVSVLTAAGTFTVTATLSGNIASSPQMPTGSTLACNFGHATGTLKF